MFGVARYEYLGYEACRDIGVVTPEDIYPLFDPGDGSDPVRVVPMFLLYDYTFRPEGTANKLTALALARERNVVATDEFLLSPEPFPTRDAWGRARIRDHPTPAGGHRSGREDDPDQSLAPASGTVRRTHLSRVRALVRQRTDGRLAHRSSTRPAASTAISTSRGPPGTTASGSKRCRSATRGNGRVADCRIR